MIQLTMMATLVCMALLGLMTLGCIMIKVKLLYNILSETKYTMHLFQLYPLCACRLLPTRCWCCWKIAIRLNNTRQQLCYMYILYIYYLHIICIYIYIWLYMYVCLLPNKVMSMGVMSMGVMLYYPILVWTSRCKCWNIVLWVRSVWDWGGCGNSTGYGRWFGMSGQYSRGIGGSADVSGPPSVGVGIVL